MTLYQLVANGPMAVWDGGYKHYSRRVFPTKELALAHKEEFIKSCTTPKDKFDMYYLERVDSVFVVELELEQDEAK